MNEYITNFSKQNNIDLKYEKFPIQLFLDQPMNTSFIDYKKRKLFREVIQTVETMVKQKEDEERKLREQQEQADAIALLESKTQDATIAFETTDNKTLSKPIEKNVVVSVEEVDR